MRTRLKALVGSAYCAAGALRRRHAGRGIVLTFHRVRPEGEMPAERPMRNLEVDRNDFRRILAWMSARYEPFAIGDWLAGKPLPAQGGFAVTFDDGWADNHTQAFPVLRELGIPATVFLATAAVEERKPFWWQVAGLTDAEIEKAKAGRSLPRVPVAGDAAQASADFLTWGQIEEMGRSGLVTFGPHGHAHELMTTLTREEALADILRCWELMRGRIPDAWVPALAWPNGNARDDLEADLEKMGLRAAFGTGRGTLGTDRCPRWNLPRNNVDRHAAQHAGLLPWLLMRAR